MIRRGGIETIPTSGRARVVNETGKGGHRHVGEIEEPYQFSDTDRPLADFFWRDVDEWRQ